MFIDGFRCLYLRGRLYTVAIHKRKKKTQQEEVLKEIEQVRFWGKGPVLQATK